MIIIETTTRERLVLVPEERIVCTEHTRDATPEDLARAGYVLREQAAPGTLAHLRADLRDMAARAEKAERERDDARRLHSAAEAQVACRNELRARLTAAERERDDAKAECQGAMLSAYAQYAETVRERDEARAELARLRPDGVDEPLDVELGGVFAQAKRDNETGPHVVSPLRVVYRLGVAHERARQQPAQDRATDEELGRAYSAAYARAWESKVTVTPDRGERAGVLAVAARVRQERCLVAQAVDAHMSTHVYRRGPDDWAVALGPRFVECEPADVPATLARLLGEVAR